VGPLYYFIVTRVVGGLFGVEVIEKISENSLSISLLVESFRRRSWEGNSCKLRFKRWGSIHFQIIKV